MKDPCSGAGRSSRFRCTDRRAIGHRAGKVRKPIKMLVGFAPGGTAESLRASSGRKKR